MAPEAHCPDCGQTKYNRVRKFPCPKCFGKLKGYVVRGTAKDCAGSNCSHGVKTSDPGKDCDQCLGTGKKLSRCVHPDCVNGQMEYACKEDEFHGHR